MRQASKGGKRSKERDHRYEYRRKKDEARQKTRMIEATPFSVKTLDRVLQSMEARKTGGPDDIQISFLQHITPYAKNRLPTLFNRSFREGEKPAAWRIAETIAIEKPGKQGEFWPISLTNSIARCMEKLILTKMGSWVESFLSHTSKLVSGNTDRAKKKSQA